MIVTSRAPSNIALLKYMGKSDSGRNIPENPSLSMTLDALCSIAELETGKAVSTPMRWVPELPRLAPKAAVVPDIGEKGALRVLAHVARCRDAAREIFSRFGLALNSDPAKVLRTANTFPQASGIASSASSFAAVTVAAAASCAADRAAFERAWEDPVFRGHWARVSRQGSGSSCRSFDGPFVLWEGEDPHPITSRLPKLAHFVLLISDRAKAVSSSEAHSRVKTSPLWAGRVERVESRVATVTTALTRGDLPAIARTVWSEFWEMHSLFHTCAEPFTYFEAGTVEALHGLSPFLRESQPPVVTMDAGPNVHVIVEEARAQEWEERLRKILGTIPSARGLLRDSEGGGARLL